MRVVRVGLVGLFCALVGTGVAAAANGSGADSAPTSTIAPVARSGNTGNVNVSSQASNSAKTGASNSISIANPVSTAGGVGGGGASGTSRTGQALSAANARPVSHGGVGGAIRDQHRQMDPQAAWRDAHAGQFDDQQHQPHQRHGGRRLQRRHAQLRRRGRRCFAALA